MTRRTVLTNGRIVTPERIIEGGCVVLAGSRIEHVGRSPPASTNTGDRTTVDVDGGIVMPGLIDLHGDDIERQLCPRSGVRIAPSLALATSDRFNLVSGVTTKFHAIAFEDAPAENRSLARAVQICREISRATYPLIDNRIHVRCELTSESVSTVQSLLDDLPVDLLSMMHHAPGEGQFDEQGFEDHYTTNKNCTRSESRKLATKRRSVSEATLLEQVERVADLAHRRGITLASHDDESSETVDRMAEVGVAISEYPISLVAARRASRRELTTAMGAPNLVNGGSHCGNLDVQTAIDEGVVDVLCSDYHPPSLLEAPFVDTGEPLVTRVRRVTANPADAVGFEDRGRLNPGARGDVLVVDPDPFPTVEELFVAGRHVVRNSVSNAG